MKINPATQIASPETFARLDAFDCIIDVRSPAEFADDHIPGAINCPVLDDQQRIEVGTLYKQVSPFEAKKIGAALVAENIARHLKQNFLGQAKDWQPLIYCWRGGQRSGAMTTVFRQIGWNAKQLEGGYKAYRRYVVDELSRLPRDFRYWVVKGATGSAKTRVLHAMADLGAQIVDLEGLAGHKGSVFGLVPETTQPSQKTFETTLCFGLKRLDPRQPVFIEAESRKIGGVHVPECLIESMRGSPCLTIDAPRAVRVDYLLRDYAYFTQHTDYVLQRLDALKQFCGEKTVQKWRTLVLEQQWPEFVDALLADHYDPLYEKSQKTNYGAGALGELLVPAPRLDESAIPAVAAAALAAAAERDLQAPLADAPT
jgi:tRNA 2-selenouridine synthase